MALNYLEVFMQIVSICLVIAAAGLWAGAGLSMRPKHRDEQTLIGGTIWSQIIIPIGLMISKEEIEQFVEGYYLVAGILLLWITGIVLGAFNLVLTKVDLCKGPKKRDCGEFRMKINNSVIIDFDVLLYESFTPNKGKVLAISNGNEFLRLQINKPCENLFMKPVLMKLFNATNSCVIKKGHYTFALDFQEVLRAYYGGMHLYGLYAFKSIFYSDQCNLSCTVIEVRISGNR